MSLSIQGKTAIVTGAANGIGLAIARHFSDLGANVVFTDRDEERLFDECGASDDERAPNIRAFAGDLSEKLTVANLISATIDAFDRVDILVNACRQIIPTDPFDPADTSIEQMLQQNLFTSLRLSQAVAKKMIAQAEGDDRDDETRGAIVNISNIAAMRSHPDLMGYSVSLAALEQSTRSLALSLAPNRIRVNAVSFGSVMSASLQAGLAEDELKRKDIQSHTPLGRIASAREVAGVAQFFASDGAGFVTGQVLCVDGGRSLLDPVGVPLH